MKKTLVLTIGIISSCFSVLAQDFHYSQFYHSPLTCNPGNTGVFNGDIRIYTMYRMQWFTVTNPFKTFTIALDGPIFKKRMVGEDFFAAGLNINRDNQGPTKIKTNSYYGLISYTKYFGGRQKHDLTLGYRIGYIMKSASYGGVTWDSQWDGTNYNPGVGVNESGGGGRAYFDMSTGIVWNFRTTHLFRSALGFSFHHFTLPNVTIKGGSDRLIPQLAVHWNMNYKLSETSNTTLEPSLMAAQQGTSLLINGGCNVKYVLQEASRYTDHQQDKAVHFGVFYRFRDAAFVTLGLDYASFNFSVAYDINISGLTPASKSVGGIELRLQYRTYFKNINAKRSSVRFMN
ncbi:MAG: PorP/SprF family type IX secretion system membrane protein [Bacteroidota bacterium]